MTTYASGQTLTAAMLTALATFAEPLQIIKAATGATRTSTTASTADSELTLTFPANRTYEYELELLLLSAANAAGDFRGRIAWTNSATVHLVVAGLADTLALGAMADYQGTAANAGVADTTTPTGEMVLGCSTTATAGYMRGRIITGASPVVATLEWAQFVSNASATSVLAGSSWTARRTA